MTKGGALKKTVKEKMERFEAPDGVKAKVLEYGGRKTISVLMKSDPFPRERCSREECSMREGKCGETCYFSNANYRLKCKRCDKMLELGIVEEVKKMEEAEENGNVVMLMKPWET
jgi:hypothetical protein